MAELKGGPYGPGTRTWPTSQRQRRISPEEIEAGKSARGGWTRRQLAELGVPWPPKGWKRALIKGELLGGKLLQPRNELSFDPPRLF